MKRTFTFLHGNWTERAQEALTMGIPCHTTKPCMRVSPIVLRGEYTVDDVRRALPGIRDEEFLLEIREIDPDVEMAEFYWLR